MQDNNKMNTNPNQCCESKCGVVGMLVYRWNGKPEQNFTYLSGAYKVNIAWLLMIVIAAERVL